VPIELRGGMPMLTLRIGDAQARVLFDLGDQSTLVLHKDVLERLGAVPTGSVGTLIQAKGSEVRSPDYAIRDLRIGDAAFPEVIARLEVHDPSYQPNDVGQDGFLGTGLLKPFVVRIDYANKTLTLLRDFQSDAPLEGCIGDAIPFAPEWHGEAVTEVRSDLGRSVLWWDTGSPATVLSRRFVDQARRGSTADEISTAHFVIGDRDYGETRLQIWDVNLPAGFHGFVGKDFFERHVVCVDYPGHRLLIPR